MTLYDLKIYRDMLKSMVVHLENKGKMMSLNKNKTAKDVAELSVKMFLTRRELHITQSQINNLITEG